MSNDAVPSAPRAGRRPGGITDCDRCPLRSSGHFQPCSAAELAFIDSLKQDELEHPAGAVLIREGEDSPPLYTLLSGWAMRYKTLPDGRRQILNFLLPGDFLGLQQKMSAAAAHAVAALTPVRLCRFPRDAVWQLHREMPSLSFDLTWLAANESSLLDDNLLSVGRRTAVERVGALLLTLHARSQAQAEPASEASDVGKTVPLTRQHLADALGLSLVHTHRALRALRQQGLLSWSPPGPMLLPQPRQLARLAHLRWPLVLPVRPLI